MLGIGFPSPDLKLRQCPRKRKKLARTVFVSCPLSFQIFPRILVMLSRVSTQSNELKDIIMNDKEHARN